MALTVQQQAESYGLCLDENDLAIADDLITEAAEVVVQSISTEALAVSATTETDVGGAGVSATTGHIIRARHTRYLATEIPAHKLSAYSDSATTEIPIWYRSGGTAYIVPAGGSFDVVRYPTVVRTTTSVTGFGRGFIRLTGIMWAARMKQREIRRLLEELPALLTVGTIPTPPTAPSFSYSSAAAATVSGASVSSVTAPSATIAALPTDPVYTEIDPAETATDYTTYLGEEDPEMMRVTLERMANELRGQEAGIRDNIAAFNASNVAFQGESTRVMEQGRLDMQASVANFQGGIQRVLDQARLTQERYNTQARLTTDVSVKNASEGLAEQVQQYAATLQKYQSDIGGFLQEAQRGQIAADTNMRRYRVRRDALRQEEQQLMGRFEEERLRYERSNRTSFSIAPDFVEF